MVNYQTAVLDRTFAALADPTRRALLARLDEEEGLTVSELARPFPVSLPAIMKHLDVLSDAGLIERTKSGRTVTCQLKAAPMEQAMNWLARYERYWTEQLDRLAAFLEEEFMASKPSLALKRRFKASPAQLFEAWTQPQKMIRWWGVTGHPKTPIAEADLKVGGRFRVQFHTPDGEQHSVSGVYREIEPDRKLVFSWAWQSTPERESQVTIDLKPDGDSTILTLTHEQFFDEKARDDHRRGWTLALDNLEKVFP